MKIFGERPLSDVLQGQIKQLKDEVYSEDKNRLLNMNETEYVAYLVSKYRIEPLTFDWDNISISDEERDVSNRNSPFGIYAAGQPQFYRRQVITYHIPFAGETDLLHFVPSTYFRWTTDVSVTQDCITFSIVNWNNDAGEIKREAEHITKNIREQAGNVINEVNIFNGKVEPSARQLYSQRKSELLAQSNLVASLGVPFRKASQIPATFSVPAIKKKVAIRPSAPSTAYNPEPTLDESIYGEILRIIHETGVEMERHPSIYRGKDEESLRDYFIMVLSPNFESVTGETFNRVGKTDILVRHERANAFVAECKFWGGIRLYFETIDQALGYLTWRDSKAAIVCFVQNKELQPVLDQIQSDTPKHPCCVKNLGKKLESWFQFEFHLKGDNTRSVRLAVLCFHFP